MKTVFKKFSFEERFASGLFRLKQFSFSEKSRQIDCRKIEGWTINSVETFDNSLRQF